MARKESDPVEWEYSRKELKEIGIQIALALECIRERICKTDAVLTLVIKAPGFEEGYFVTSNHPDGFLGIEEARDTLTRVIEKGPKGEIKFDEPD